MDNGFLPYNSDRELDHLSEDLGVEYKNTNNLIDYWRNYIIELLEVEYKKFNGKVKK